MKLIDQYQTTDTRTTYEYVTSRGAVAMSFLNKSDADAWAEKKRAINPAYIDLLSLRRKTVTTTIVTVLEA